MGLRDSMNRMAEEQKERRGAALETAAEVVAGCPDPPNHYDTETNRGSVNMGALKQNLFRRFQQGYRLAHAFEQNGNTVLIFEHSHD